MITCPNKNLPEWQELERVVPELAYTIWDNNNGYGIDRAPNGQPSKLFSDLLKHYNGDREATLRAKSKVYSTAFKQWFGDWVNDPLGSSKVVDENNEPLVVYHVTRAKFDSFDSTFSGVGSGNKENTNGVFYFSKYVESAMDVFKTKSKSEYDSYNIIPVFLSIKNINKVPLEEFNRTFVNKELFDSFNTKDGIWGYPEKSPEQIYNEAVLEYNYNKASGNLDRFDRLPSSVYDFIEEQTADVFVATKSNQIKSIDNYGTFNETNNIYNRESNYNSSEMINNHIDSIKEIGTSNKLIEYIDTLNDVSPYMKQLLNRMKKMSTNIEIHPTATSQTLVAQYNPKTSTIHLFADVISSTSNQELADSVAHELLHHYLAKMYYTDETFKEEVDRIRDIFKEKLGKDANKWYGFRDQDSSDEALNEIMSNSNLRLKLQETDKTLWDKLVDLFRKYILGEDIKENNDLKSLTETINSLIDHINTHDIDIYVNEQFKEMLMNKQNTNSTENNNELLTKIVKGLQQRLESIKRYTKRNIKSENELQELITKLSQNDMLQAVPEFVDHINDSIDSASKFLNKSIKDINPKQIRQLNEDYIGFYKPLLDQIKYELDTSDTFKDIPDLQAFTNMVDTLQSQMTTINNKFANISKAKAIEILSEHLENVGAPQRYIDETISWINNPNNDGNFLTVWAGMSSESNNQIVASIANMIVNTNNKTARFTYEQGAKLMPILDAAKQKHGNKVQELLYEKLLDGTYSGLLVRDINYGQYKHNFKQHLSKLSEELGIKKDNDGNYILPEDEKILNKWYDGINKFYEKHIERKYLPEYYALRNKILSAETRTALDEVNGSINQLLDSTVSEDGVIMENLLSPEQKARLESLRRTKKLLGVEYNLDGTPKSGSAGRIASEIRKFNEEVGSDNNYVPDYDKFNADDKKVAAKYGKNSKEYTDWYKANTITRNNEAFYERLQALGSVDQSDDYKQLTSKRQQLLNIYKDPHTQDINVDEMSDKEKQMLVSLDQDIADIYQPGERVQNDEEDKFSDFAEVILTDKYLRDYRAAQASGQQIFDDWFMKNHYEDYKGRMKPAKYYTKLVPVQSLKDQYTETIPYGRYSKLDENSKYYNKNYIDGGQSVQPKKSLYDNSKQFDVINSSKELKNLYDTYIKTKQSFDNMLSFMSTNDVYRMPQISARTLQAISRSNGVLSALKYVFEDVATTKEDDTDYVQEFATKPNGKPLRVVPTRYIRMLKNTNNISTDAIGSLIEYGNMAANYVNMTEQRDQLELLLNILENSKFTTKTQHKDKGAMNYYQQAQLLVDRLVYGKNKVPMKFTVGKKEINASKILDITRDYVSKVNLSYNMWSIGTSLLTDIGYTTLESTLGRFFNTKDLRFATTEFSSQLPYILSNTGNPTPNNKITYLMQLNQVVRDNKEIYERLDQSAAVRAMNQNFWFAGYTQADYTVKGHTTVAIYHNYKFVKGVGFMSENQYLNKYHKEDRKTGKVKFSQLPISLYDAYIEKDGKWAVDDKYKQYVTESLMNNVKNRIDILTRRVDGTLRDVDKAKIHTNSIAAYVTQHRNFMIQGMHNRFKGRTFNQDLGVEEEGYYRGMTRFLKNIIGQKHFALSQLLADYDKLEEFEQYSVRKVTSELMMVSSSTLVALTIASLVDGDDDYDNWLSEAITYLALRSAFEFRTMYNPMELMSMIKSPTAAFSWFDNTMGMFGIFNPFSYIYAKSPLEALDRGVYKGFPRIVKSLVKATPIKNIIEAQDPKIKRNYLQNQLMSF